MRPKKHRTTGIGQSVPGQAGPDRQYEARAVQLAGNVDWDWIDIRRCTARTAGAPHVHELVSSGQDRATQPANATPQIARHARAAAVGHPARLAKDSFGVSS